MRSNFEDLGISAPILQAIADMGFESPTEVQSQAIPPILEKKDLIVKSKTGSGKTAVFGVSMLQLTDPDAPGPQGLILTPTRELAVQVDSDLKKLARHLPHKTTAVYGQHNLNTEIQELKKGSSIVTGTPGRVYDHIYHGHLRTKNIHFLVLDEADRMLDMGFLDQVERIIKTLPRKRVTLLFSATIPPEIHKICSVYMKDPLTIEIESQTKTVETTQQAYYRVDPKQKNLQLNRLLLYERPQSCVIFCNTRYMVDRVQTFLFKKGYASKALHGDIPQVKRMKALQQFKQGDFHILVATDVAARGIHIDDLSLVVNYDVPNEKDSYVHRIGRTGRAGNVGRAVSLVTGDDIMTLYEIEEHIGALIPEEELPDEAYYNDKQEIIQQWKKANAVRQKPPQATTSASAGGQKRPQNASPRSAQQSAKQQKRSAEAKTEQKKYSEAKSAAPAERIKAEKAVIKPMPQPVAKATPGEVQTRQEAVQNKPEASRPSFLLRLRQRFLGR